MSKAGLILLDISADNLKEMQRFLKKLPIILFFRLLAFPISAFCQVDTAWVRYYSGPGEAWATAVDDSGNVYVAGVSGIPIASWVVLKYNRNGNLVWIRQRPSVIGGVNHLILDSAGNVYATGGDPDYTTVKYDPQGNEVWVATYNGPAGGVDWAHWMAIDKANNVYVTGRSADSSGGRETAVIKYDANGNQRWAARYNGPLNFDQASFIAVDENHNVCVAGRSGDYMGDEKEWLIINYDSLGQEKWVRTFQLWPNTTGNQAAKVKFDVFGNIIVTGGSTDSTGKQVYVTIKYDALGNTLWIARENGPTGLVIVMDLDSLGNIYLSGYSGFDISTIKYDFNGNKLWEHRYTSPGSGGGSPSGIKVDKTGNVYVAGFTTGIGTGLDFTALKLDSMGNELWVKRYVGPDSSSYDWGMFATADEMGNVYITGKSGRNAQYDIMTLKYAPLPALKGDLNLDGVLTMTDVVLMLNFTFNGNPFAAAPSAGDLNCDGKISPADTVIMLQIFFHSAPPPC